MTWSVAMCTFNGARYVQQQLDSIAAQTLQPDQLVVVDDASTDGTPGLLDTFASTAVFPVQVIRRTTNVGSTAAFQQAIAATTGSLVALADQDDVWHREKLALLQAVFDTRPAAGLIFSDADLIDDAGVRLPGTAWTSPRVGFDPETYDSADSLQFHLEHSVVTGAAVAFRGWLRDAALPFPELVGPRPVPWKLHDGWLALVAALASDVVPEPTRLISYRVHPAQQVGLAAEPTAAVQNHLQRLTFRRQVSALLLDRARALSDPPARAGVLTRLEDEVTHLDARLTKGDPPAARVRRVAGEWRRGGYHRWSGGARGALRDLAGL